jgi:hypothetical protein
VLGRDHRSLHDQHVDPCLERHLVVLTHPLRGERTGSHDTLGFDLLDPLSHELRLDRLLVDLLHLARRLVGGQPSNALELPVGVLVAAPYPLEVEHREAAEATDNTCRLRRDHAVHGGCQHRQLEPIGTQRPGDVDVVGVARAPRRHNRDVVEPVGAPTLLPLADLELHQGILDARPAQPPVTNGAFAEIPCWRRPNWMPRLAVQITGERETP